MGIFFLRGISMAYIHSPRGAHITLIRDSGMAEIKPKVYSLTMVLHHFQHLLPVIYCPIGSAAFIF